MSVARANGEFGPIDFEFQHHPNEEAREAYRGESVTPETNVVVLTEFQRFGGEHGMTPHKDNVGIRLAFDTLDKRLGKEKAKNLSVVVVDVPVFEREHIGRGRRDNLGDVATVAGAVTAAYTAKRVVDKSRGTSSPNRESKKESGSYRLGRRVGNVLSKEKPTRRKFLGLVGISSLFFAAGEAINNSVLGKFVQRPGKAGPFTNAARKTGAWFQNRSPSFIVEGRNAVAAQRIEQVLELIHNGQLDVGLKRGQKINVAGLNSGGNHGDIIRMIEDSTARRDVLEYFYQRIKQIPNSYRQKAFVFSRDKNGKIVKKEVTIPSLLSREQMKRLEARLKQRPRRHSSVPLEKRKMGRADFLRARWGQNKRPRRRA